MYAILGHRAVWLDLLLLLLFSTLLPFILMSLYQPWVAPSRAALIYLLEPIAAASYAYVVQGRGLGTLALVGVSLIVLANMVVELLQHARRPR